MFIRFTVRVLRECLSVCVCASFPFGFEGGIWDLIVLILDHCLSIYLKGNLPGTYRISSVIRRIFFSSKTIPNI